MTEFKRGRRLASHEEMLEADGFLRAGKEDHASDARRDARRPRRVARDTLNIHPEENDQCAAYAVAAIKASITHHDDHDHDHHHHETPAAHAHDLVRIEKDILARNDAYARENRERLSEAGVFADQPRIEPRLGQDHAPGQDHRDAEIHGARGRDRGRPGDLARCRAYPRHGRAHASDQYRPRLSPRRAHGRPRARELAAQAQLDPVHRECRQPRLSGRLRPRRGAKSGDPLGDRGRRQAAEIS